MSPVAETPVEAAPNAAPVTAEGTSAAPLETGTTVPEATSAAAPAETTAGTPAAAATTVDGVPTTPAPTKVGAYKNRGIRTKHSILDIVPLLLRILTAVFTLIAFSVIASDTQTFVTSTGFFLFTTKVHFNDFFFFR
jgi:hypothetical protein